MNMQAQITSESLTRDQAIALIERVIETGDQSILEPFIEAAMTGHYRNAITAMAIAQSEPNRFELFMAICADQSRKLISVSEIAHFSVAYWTARDQAA
jgi:hypothetical protein